MSFLISIIWIVSALLLGMTARNSGRSFIVWLAIGVATSPLFSWLLFLVLVKGK